MNEIGSVNSVRTPDANGLKKDSQAELKKALSEFESLFINYMLKTMKETVSEGDLFHGGSGEDVYSSLFDAELSRLMASGNGMGLKTMMMQQLSNEHKISVPDEISRSLEPMIRPERAFEPKKEEVSARISDTNENGDDPFNFPLHKKGVRISSGYGMREDPLTKAERFHHGIDIAASKGSPIYPAARGEVIFSGEKGGYGNVVEVLHDNGVVTRYGHNSKNLVKKGDKVSPGDPIAYVGSTGRSTGPHVHFEVIKNGEAVDPEKITYG